MKTTETEWPRWPWTNPNPHLGDVHGAKRVGADVDLDDAVVVVRNVKVNVGEEIVTHLGLTGLENLLDLADESPDGEVVVVHLKVVVILDGFAELFQILRVELFQQGRRHSSHAAINSSPPLVCFSHSLSHHPLINKHAFDLGDMA